MSKPKIAFVTGGYSGEKVISYQSAKTIEQNIDTDQFDYYKIDITPDGWFFEKRFAYSFPELRPCAT